MGVEDTLAGNDKYKRLWRLAQPYLDTRENQFHTRISVALALRLIEQEGGDPEVVIPAVILHDVGWKRIPEDLHLKAFGPDASAPELNRTHEVEGVKIARSLLREVSYDRSIACEILAIIDGHDSRNEPFCKNDAIVKDADKLWRYTREGFAIDIERFGETFDSGIARLSDNLGSWFLTDSGNKSAADLLRQRKKEKTSGPEPCQGSSAL